MGGVLISRPAWLSDAPGGGPSARIAGVSTDSRAVAEGQVFFALHGESFDGHAFLAQAAEAGAAVLVVDREDVVLPAANAGPRGRGVAVIRVADTRRALGKLAQAYRRSLGNTKVIAVCGSNGKTTTVRILDAVLSQRLRGTASKKSFNNDIGVPITIFSAKPGDQYLICEVGTNAPGEIAALGDIVEPDIAVITSIGREHLEKLISVQGVAREESAILSFVRAGGLGVIPGDSPELSALVGTAERIGGAALLRFGRGDGCDLRLTGCEGGEVDGRASVRFTVNARQTFEVALEGEHNASNSLAAIGVARRLGVDDDAIRAGLLNVQAPEMRWQRQRVAHAGGTIELINDAYNANPDSMIASLRTFTGTTGAARRVFVMGDMFELGEASEAGHRDVGRFVAASGAAEVMITVGPMAGKAGEEARSKLGAAGVLGVGELDEGALAEIKRAIRPGDLVLLKGSRRMKLERLIKALAGA